MSKALELILFVEDDPDIRAVACMALEAVGGFSVAAFGSGTEAVAAAAAMRPDLILLDVMMPEMDGPTTLRRLRELPGFAGTPVVFMTAKVLEEELGRYRAMGAAGVIAKPFDPMTLADRVREIWSGAGA